MPLDEKKLRAILAKQEESIKRHVGLLAEESDRKFGLVQEGFQGLSDKVEAMSDKMEVEFAAIRKEIGELRILLFRKADLERLEAVEKRVSFLEKRVLGG